jgi:hypothetical protein
VINAADQLRLALVALQHAVDAHEDTLFRMMASFAELKAVRAGVQIPPENTVLSARVDALTDFLEQVSVAYGEYTSRLPTSRRN